MRIFCIAIAIIVMTVLPATADSSTGSSDDVAVFQSDSLQLQLFFVRDARIFEDWNKPEVPKFDKETQVRRGGRLMPVIVFATTSTDTNGNADLTYDIRILRPDGRVHAEFEDLTLWNKKPAPQINLVEQPMGIDIWPRHPLGSYEVQVKVKDLNSDRMVELSLGFEVVN